MLIKLDEDIKSQICSLIREKYTDAFASLVYGPYAGGYADEKTAISILAIADLNKPTLKFVSERIADRRAHLLITDRENFERDVENEHLGGILSENLLVPYEPIAGADYLWRQEVKIKKKVIKDALANLILNFPEMSKSLLIKTEYFIFEYMVRKAALFPLTSYRFLNVIGGEIGGRNLAMMTRGFKAAVEELIDEGVLQKINGDVLKISDQYVESVRERRRHRFKTWFSTTRTSMLRYALGIFSDVRKTLLDEYRIYRMNRAKNKSVVNSVREIENPGKYIFLSTASGTVAFTEKISVEEIVRRYMPKADSSSYTIRRLGGILNSVYILKLSDGNLGNIVIKVFKDWYGWKWFPLALWTLGTRDLAVFGKTRLEREYTMNRLLSNHKINVPKIIYVNPEEKVIFQEYIEGTTASKLVKQLYKLKDGEEKRRIHESIREIGREIAKIHSLGVSIGDCKLENIILTPDGKIFFVDLEQAEKGGDQAWDIAEFLYYPGHYALLPPLNVVKEVVREFIYGYIESGGKVENVKRALSPKYIKVFSFSTPPHIIFIISDLCRRLLRDLEEKSLQDFEGS